MMNKITSILTTLLMVIVFLVPATASAQQDLFKNVCGTGNTGQAAVCQDKSTTQDASNNSIFGKNGILTSAARIVTIVVGIASVIMIIVGGIRYVMSSGDSNNINGAKNTILYALIGLVVAVLAGSIIQFVISKL